MAQTLVIPSAISEVLRVLEMVDAQAAREGFSDRARFAIRLAVDEALCNAIRHGNKCDLNKKVQITIDFTAEAFDIVIQDEGTGFVPEKVPDPTLEENLGKLGGRGVLLMKAYMTHVDYNDKGNCVHLVKGRNCKLPCG